MEAGVVVAVVTVSLVIGATAVKVVAWVFKAAVRSALEPIERKIALMEVRQGLLWSIAEQRAMETLHHPAQPAFDFLIEQFQAHTMTGQQLTQFIERLEVLAADETRTAGEMPSVKLLLETARAHQKTRLGLPDISAVSLTASDENLAAARAMALESEPSPVSGPLSPVLP